MTESITATTITLAEQGDIGLGNWVWMCVGIIVLAAIALVASIIRDDEFFGSAALVIGVIAFIAWIFLVGTQDTRTSEDLVSRQAAALDEQHNISHVTIDEGSFVGSNDDGIHIEGRIFHKDGNVYYVIIEDLD